VEKRWRHLNFFQHKTELIARVPRVKCPKCGVRQVQVPWARPDSGFTALFEAFCMTLAKDMPITKIADLVEEYDTRIWRIVRHHVSEGRGKEDYSEVKELGVDETSARKGHNYISIFVDMAKAKVIFATPGKGAGTFKDFKADFISHKGKPENVRELSMDMSAAFISGAKEQFPNAAVTFDKFHCVALLNDAVEEVRREETKLRPELKGTRWVWLRNVDTMSDEQQATLDELSTPKLNLKTAKAYQIKLLFQDIYTLPPALAEPALEKWHRWASRCKLPPMEKAARTVKERWDGILRWFGSGLTNGTVECINGLIQTVKRRARGFRNMENFIAMIYLQCGKLKLSPSPT
jgi:transposase